MVVHVPTDSISIGVPPGNRRGRLVASERTLEVVIPADSGGQGQQAWSRMQFTFEIDRFTNNGALAIGEEKYGEAPTFQIRCEAGIVGPIRAGAAEQAAADRRAARDGSGATAN